MRDSTRGTIAFPVLAVGAATALLYLWTAGPWLMGGDNGEFATLFATGGVAHPPGYPWYVIWLRGWAPLLQSLTPVHGAAVATAVLGVLSVMMVCLACIRWGVSPMASAAATMLYACGRVPWLLATQAEVFALHALICAAILAAAAPVPWRRAWLQPLVLGGLAGMGLSHHLTSVALAPLGLWALHHAARRTGYPWRAWLGAVAAGLSTLSVVLLMPWLASHGAWSWGDLSTWGGLWDHWRRADYGVVSLGLYGDARPSLDNLSRLMLHLLLDGLVVGPLLALAGVVQLMRTAREAPQDRAGGPGLTTAALVCWALSWVLAGPVLVGAMNLAPQGLALRVIERFYLMPQLLLTLPTAVGVDHMIRSWRFSRTSQWSLLVACTYLPAAVHLEAIRQEHQPTLQEFLENTLEQLPPDAVLLGGGDHRLFGYLYLQTALNLRPDVIYLDAALLHMPWYAQRTRRLWPEFPLPGAGGGPDSTLHTPPLVQAWLDRGRPVYLTHVLSPTLAGSFALVPAGALFRILPPGAPAPRLPELVEENRRIAANYRMQAAPVPRTNAWAALAWQDYRRPWAELARACEAAGDLDCAARMSRLAARFLTLDPASPFDE